MNDGKDYRYKISMELFGQILFAIQGNPDKSSNQKQHIFGKYYDEIFSEKNFNISEAPVIIERYFDVKKAYDTAGGSLQKIEQKVFYILYMHQVRPDLDYNQCIEELERILKIVEPSDKKISDARKMIQVRFKESLNSELGLT